jgi:glycosyltransferase involved in cell wall biosynthesis
MTVDISVIIPNRNMGHFLGDTLASIARQDAPNLEVIVADAGSDDGSSRWRDDARVLGLDMRWIDLGEAVSPAVARNRALEEATGAYIAFVDADDLWPAGKLRRQRRFLEENPAIAMVSGRIRYFDHADAEGLAPAADARISDLVHVHVGACLWREGALRALGGFDESFRFSEDVDLLLRAREAAVPIAVLPTIELYYRQHAASMMASADPARERDFHRAALLSIRRRRAAGVAPIQLPPLESFLVP